MAYLLENDMKIPECGCRPSQSRSSVTHSFSIQDILGLDKTGEKKSASESYNRESSYFSVNTADTVIKVEPRSPTSAHLGNGTIFKLCFFLPSGKLIL